MPNVPDLWEPVIDATLRFGGNLTCQFGNNLMALAEQDGFDPFDIGQPGFTTLRDLLQGQGGCSPSSYPVAPPFTGGQCAFDYRVSGQVQGLDSGQTETANFLRTALPGPIGQPELLNAGEESSVIGGLIANGPTMVIPCANVAGYTTVAFNGLDTVESIVSMSVTPTSGGPDECGNLAPSPEPIPPTGVPDDDTPAPGVDNPLVFDGFDVVNGLPAFCVKYGESRVCVGPGGFSVDVDGDGSVDQTGTDPDELFPPRNTFEGQELEGGSGEVLAAGRDDSVLYGVRVNLTTVWPGSNVEVGTVPLYLTTAGWVSFRVEENWSPPVRVVFNNSWFPAPRGASAFRVKFSQGWSGVVQPVWIQLPYEVEKT